MTLRYLTESRKTSSRRSLVRSLPEEPFQEPCSLASVLLDAYQDLDDSRDGQVQDARQQEADDERCSSDRRCRSLDAAHGKANKCDG